MPKATTRKEQEAGEDEGEGKEEEEGEGGEEKGRGEGALSLEPMWVVTGPAVVLRRLYRATRGGRSGWRALTETVGRRWKRGEGEMVWAQRGLLWRGRGRGGRRRRR